MVKKLLGLQFNIATSFFYLSLKNGGLGLSQLRYDIPRITLTRMLRLSNSNFWFVRHVIATAWFGKEVARLNRLCPAANDNCQVEEIQSSRNLANNGSVQLN